MKKAIKILTIITIIMHGISLPATLLCLFPPFFIILGPTMALNILGFINSIKIFEQINNNETPTVEKGIIALIANTYYGAILGLLIFLSQPKEENNLI